MPKKETPKEEESPAPTKKVSAKVAKDKFLKPPRGMRDLMGDEYFAYQGFAERAAEIALYYGFSPIETPVLEHEEIFLRGLGEVTDVVEKEMYTLRTKGSDRLSLRPEPTAGIMRSYISNGMQSLPQPVMLYTHGNYYRHEKPQRGRYREFRQFDLEVLGTEKSVADAMIMKIVLTILEDIGVENLSLQINSIGDKECRPVFRKELIAYYKKHLGSVCKDCVQRFKTNPMRLLDCKKEECQEVKKDAPIPISFLCEPCKKHLREVFEYLEALDIPYEINNSLVRGLDYYTRTVFEVFGTAAVSERAEIEELTPLAIAGGGRYDYLAKMMGAPKPVAAVGTGIGMDRVIDLVDASKLSPRIVKKPKVFFIQLGFEAKLKSLYITEILRKAKIPVTHAVSKDSLGSQLAVAEKLGLPYSIILGQREVIDDMVIVRTMKTRSQKNIPIAELADYLKTLK